MLAWTLPADSLDTATSHLIRSLLQDELGFLIGGTVFLVVGMLALLLSIVRREARNGLVLPFALMSIIWGLRFIARAPVVDIGVNMDPDTWIKFRRSLTFLITMPAFMFSIRIFGFGRWNSLLVMTGIATLFAVVAPILIFTGSDPAHLLHAFNVMALIGMAALIGTMLMAENRRRPELRVLLVGGLFSVFFIALENIANLGIIGIPFEMEWIGVTILYVTLFYVTFQHFIAVSQKLGNLRQELETARRIQTSILPHGTPEMAGLDIVTRYLPMTEVAGDFYDFYPMDGNRMGCLIADVSGHGVPAALIASMVKVAFQAHTSPGAEPDDVLSGMNEMLGHRLGSQFVTASYICLDMERKRLRYSCAGHPPVLIRSGDSGDIEAISSSGLILGPFPLAEYESLERPLAHGDRILMYTDGITEAVNGMNEEFGADRVSELLKESRDLSSSDFADTLLSAVRDWSRAEHGDVHDDDLTLIVIDVTF